MNHELGLNASRVMATLRTRDAAPNGVVEVTYLELLFLLASLAVVIIVSQRLHMGLEKQLSIAAIRCFVQLSALGLILVPIIVWNKPALVLIYIVFMMLVAAVEAASRPPHVFDSLLLICFISISATVAVFGGFTFFVVLRTGLEAQYAIPIVGMITGSAMSAVSVAVSNIVTSVVDRKESIELLLLLGATRWEAGIDMVRSSIVLGLTPTLNLLSVTGLVSIPGMMTGQIIGGTPPALAAKYQLVIMYVAAGAATIATLFASLLTINVLIDSEYRVRTEKLVPRDKVNRLDSIISSARYVSSKIFLWRQRMVQQGSPFPPHVHEPLPVHSESATPFSKTREAQSDYGATSAHYKADGTTPANK